MRTTLTLEPDVAALLRMATEEGRSLEDVVNEALRIGLTKGAPKASSRKIRTAAHASGRCLVPSLDCTSEALTIAEGDGYK